MHCRYIVTRDNYTQSYSYHNKPSGVFCCRKFAVFGRDRRHHWGLSQNIAGRSDMCHRKKRKVLRMYSSLSHIAYSCWQVTSSRRRKRPRRRDERWCEAGEIRGWSFYSYTASVDTKTPFCVLVVCLNTSPAAVIISHSLSLSLVSPSSSSRTTPSFLQPHLNTMQLLSYHRGYAPQWCTSRGFFQTQIQRQ